MHDDAVRATDVLANERTFLAYLRTSLSFIAFGFVVARFALFTREFLGLAHGTAPAATFSSAFGTSVALIGGAIAVFGGYRYVVADRAIVTGRPAGLARRDALVMAAIVAIIGFVVGAVLVAIR